MNQNRGIETAAHIAGLTFVLFNSVTMLLSAGGSIFGTLAGFGRTDAVFGFFSLSGIAASLVVGVALMLATHWGIVINASTRRRAALAFAVVGAAAYAGMFAGPIAAAAPLAVIAGVASAVSYLAQFISWGARLSRVGFKQAATAIALAAGIAGILALVLFETTNSAVMCAGYCIALVAGGASAAFTTHDADELPEQVPDRKGLTLDSALWPLFAGSLLCVFTLLLMWHGVEDSTQRPFSAHITQGEFAGFIVCSLALAAIATMHPKQDALKRTLVTLCPLFAVFPMVPCIVSVEPVFPIGYVFGALTGIGFAYFMAVPIAAFCVESGVDKNAQGVWGAAAIALAVGGFAGLGMSQAVDGSLTTPITLALFIAYLVACATLGKAAPANSAEAIAAEADAHESQSDNEGTETAPVNPLQARCDELAQAWNLTPRECEVLPLLAQGRTQPSIARELYCSPETVKVHVRHIYEKSGVHSKDALLELVHAS